MVDVGYFDSVYVEGVFRRPSASDYKVVPVADRRIGNTWIRTHDTRNVLVGAGYLVYVSDTDDPDAYRALDASKKRRRLDAGCGKLRHVLIHLDLDERCVRGDPVFRSDYSPVTQLDRGELKDSRLYLFESEGSRGVSRNSRSFHSDNDYGCIRDSLAGRTVYNTTGDGVAVALCGCIMSRSRQDDGKK